MPIINKQPTRMYNGDNIIRYINSVSPQNTVYTYSKTQERVRLINKGTAGIIYTIGTKSGTLSPAKEVEVKELIDQVTLRSEKGTQHFELTSDEIGDNDLVPSTDIPISVDDENENINERSGMGYKAGQISINEFRKGSPSDIPFDSGIGTLITDRLMETSRKYTGTDAVQRFYGWKGTNVTRIFAGGAWTDWISLGELNTVKTKPYTDSSPITDFPKYKVTDVTFLSSDSSGLPAGGIGTLSTSRLGQNDVTNFQFYYPYNSADIYRRFWTSNGWSVWNRFSESVTHTVTHDFGDLSPQQTRTYDFTMEGVGETDIVTVNFRSGIASGVVPFAYVTSANSVSVRLINISSEDVTVGSRPILLLANKL